MPIEIRELQIKAAIGNRISENTSQSSNPADIQQIKQQIVKEVTEDVLRYIQLKLER